MKLIKFVLIIPVLIVQLGAWASGKALASDKLIVEPYYRIRMGIQADNEDAREVVNQIQNALMEKEIVIAKGTRDPVVEGKVVVETHEKNKVNPFGIREFTLHDVVLVLKGLKIKDSLGTALDSYQSFNGFGSHEIKSQAFADAAEQIVKQLKEKDFLTQAAKVARRQDIFIKTAGKANREEIKKEIYDTVNNFMNSLVKEIQLKRGELDDLKTRIKNLAEMKAKKFNVASNVYINESELNKIIRDYTPKPIKANYKEVKDQSKYIKPILEKVTGVIIDAKKMERLCKLRLQKIYSKEGTLVFGGKRNPDFNPLLYFESKDALLLSDFRVEAKNPITAQAIGLTGDGHIIVSDNDADRILLANKWGDGKIFTEGRIFVLTGKR